MQRRIIRVHWIAIIAAGALCADAFLISPSPTPFFPSHAKHCAEFNTLCLGKHRGFRTSAINLGLTMEVKPQLVAVVGATGGVGRLTVAACLQLGLKIRAIVRDQKKATALLPDVIVVSLQGIMRSILCCNHCFCTAVRRGGAGRSCQTRLRDRIEGCLPRGFCSRPRNWNKCIPKREVG